MLVTIISIAILAVILLGGGVAFVASRRRRGGLLEPPPRPSVQLKTTPDESFETLDLSDLKESVRETVPEPDVRIAPEAPPRFSERLGRARAAFGSRLGAIVSRGRIDETVWDELEEALIVADVGISTSTALLERLRGRVALKEISSPSELVVALRTELVTLLSTGDRSLTLHADSTNVWLFVGVNGAGKTTTIGKVASRYSAQGTKVVLAAGDTFRAAAAEQLMQWGQRCGAEVVRGGEGSDPGAVIYDAVQKAAARGANLVLGDTAGRLHTKVNLMEELKKVHRVAQRPPGMVSEVLLVIDSTTGQNGLVQAKQFAQAVGVTGVVLTKLDGSAKGGIAVAIQAELQIPIKLVGLGESVQDLIEFDPVEFVDALVGETVGG